LAGHIEAHFELNVVVRLGQVEPLPVRVLLGGLKGSPDWCFFTSIIKAIRMLFAGAERPAIKRQITSKAPRTLKVIAGFYVSIFPGSITRVKREQSKPQTRKVKLYPRQEHERFSCHTL
jgi:hypothetical protein